MNNATKFAKQKEVYETCSQVVSEVSKKVANEYEARGNDHSDAMVYSLGYMQSFLTMVISELPKNKREEILKTLIQRAA